MIQKRQKNVLQHRRTRQEVEGLEYETHAGRADRGQFIVAERERRFALKAVLARRLAIEEPDDVHECRLTGSGRTHDRDELSFLDVEIDVVKHGRHDAVVIVRLRELLERDEGRVVLHRGAVTLSRGRRWSLLRRRRALRSYSPPLPYPSGRHAPRSCRHP